MNAPVEAAVSPLLLSQTQDGVRTLTLNRGERYNPLSRAMLAALEHALDETANDASVRVVVIAGAGKGFCAGHDLKEIRAHPDAASHRELFDACGRMMVKLTQLPQPVIARVQGMAVEGEPSMSFLPSRMNARRLQCSASSMMCVETIRVTPSLFRSWKYFQSSHLNWGSTPTVGSSRKSNFGLCTSTQAMEARFLMPPDIVLTTLCCLSDRRVISRISSMRSSRSRPFNP
jgi:hypothetical protein